MNEHTKGLLRVGHSGAVVADHPVPEMSGSDAVEYYGGHLVAESVTAANARRLAACWNACDGFTTEELEAHTGPRLLRARLEGAFARIDELLSERNRVGIDISSAILSGIVPDRHPLRSRLELLANHHKHEQALADGMVAMADQCHLLASLLRELRDGVEGDWCFPGDLDERIDSALAVTLCVRLDAACTEATATPSEQDYREPLAGHVPEPVYYMRDNHTFKRLSDDVDTAITEIEAELDAGWTSGMLCSKRKGFSSLHANYRRPREEFIADCRDALLAAAPKPEGGEPCAIEPPSSSPA